ncbi:MAG: proline dehydrogenase family protein [Bdellovibrionales bacterium]|nr:proline dehydrogenase family protein [Bdellovibrionales bacterium]
MSDSRIIEIGKDIFSRSSDYEMNLFDSKFWSGKIMEWSMKDLAFKTEMFRFVDVLPSLVDSEQVAEHLRQYFFRPGLDLPAVIRGGLGLATWNSFAAKLAAGAIRKNVTGMATTFITGESVENARGNLKKIWDSGLSFTVDILGEAALSEKEAIAYQQKYLALVTELAPEMRGWKTQPHLEEAPWGAIPRANVSVKCSSLYSQMDSAAFRTTVETVKGRLRPILQAAVQNGVFVNLDMEQNDYRELLLTVAEEMFCEPEFIAYPHFGLVIQAYLKASAGDLERVVRFANKRSAPVTVRLVKGAYWDYEVAQAASRGWPVPVFTNKAETDANYEKLGERLLEAYPKVLAAFGSHNVRSLSAVLECAERRGMAKNAFEIQMLYGMADPFKKALTGMGYRLRDYAPVGDLLPGMAYLVRRLLENTSNEGFLRARFADGAAVDELLRDPRTKVQHAPHAASATPAMFENEPFRDFGEADQREAVLSAVAPLRKSFPLNLPVTVRGKSVANLPVDEVRNPSQTNEVIARCAQAAVAQADEAVMACREAMKTWGAQPAKERAAIVRRAADLMRARKAQLTALMVLEVGKNYREADADVAEGIDFCNYYADAMERLAPVRSLSKIPGESNEYLYSPRGPAVAIAPWNFPFAILCGMTVGPLVAGNPVIMKPAEQSPAIAYELFKILVEAGVPADALHFLPGKGEIVGAHLVSHSHIHIVTFTGSRAVGLRIMEDASRVVKGQRHIKKVVAEMGGKNAIIIDDDADLDEAVAAAIHSSFGFQGQKCSAASRLIVLAPCYDKFKERLREAMASLKVGMAEDPAAKVGPVIDADAQTRLLGVIERNRAKIIAQIEVPASLRSAGHFVPPTIFEDTDFGSELGQMEFFGPLVTIFRVENMDEAIRAMNDVDYALTGGIFSRSPKNIARAREEIEVGNLYINRGTTGALVGRQPFGGYKLSGVGAKAGGPDYLLQFLEPRAITENTMRRGFAPETSDA